jgi:Flp pilus assembly pilin Flp
MHVDLINRRLARLAASESGQTVPEYALLLALVALTLIAAIGILAGSLNGIYHAVGSAVSSL